VTHAEVDLREVDQVVDRPPEPDDAELVRRIARSERSALEALYVRHQTALFRYLLHFTSDRGAAEELLQDTLVAVWKNAQSFGGRSSVAAWLFGIARRRAFKRLRRRGPEHVELEAAAGVADSEPDPETALLAQVERAQLVEAVGRLAAMHQEILLLAFVQQLSYAEIAEVLGVPVGTVKSRLHAAKRALRDGLGAIDKDEDGR
jgi:RNA polymerase sigma-70 factor (ECF subfamily)